MSLANLDLVRSIDADRERGDFSHTSERAYPRFSGRGKASPIEVEQTGPKAACLFFIRDGRVMRLPLYSVRDCALVDLGVAPDLDS